MRRLLVVPIVAALGILSAGASAADVPFSVEVTPDRSEESTTFRPEATCGRSCLPEITISRNGRKFVDAEEMSGDDGSFEYEYSWSCNETGRLSWKITVDPIEADDSYTEGERTGRFTVRACGRIQPRRVRRGAAARNAAGGYSDEFVSRSLCTPFTRLTNGRASRWRCQVTHNNSYRECVSTIVLTFRKQRQFGRTVTRDRDRTTGTRCRSF